VYRAQASIVQRDRDSSAPGHSTEKTSEITTNLAFFVTLSDPGSLLLSIMAFIDFVARHILLALIGIRINRLPLLRFGMGIIILAFLQTLIARRPLVLRGRDFVGRFVSLAFSKWAFVFLVCLLFITSSILATFFT
jgi:hypothetical protein